MKTLIAIGAHEDDLETHCGGTFAKFAAEGCRCTYVNATTTPHYNPTPDEKARDSFPGNEEIIAIRKRESQKAAALLGAQEVCFWDFKSSYYYKPGTLERVRLDGMRCASEEYEYLMKQMPGREFITEACNNPASIDYVAGFIERRKPEIILVPNPCDAHYEHYLVFNLVWRSCRKLFIESKINCRIYAYEQASRAPVMSYWPTDFVDISELMELKLKATDCFVSQCADQRLGARRQYCMAQNAFWGKYAGASFAEAFWRIEPFFPDAEGAVQMDGFRTQYAGNPQNEVIIKACSAVGLRPPPQGVLRKRGKVIPKFCARQNLFPSGDPRL